MALNFGVPPRRRACGRSELGCEFGRRYTASMVQAADNPEQPAPDEGHQGTLWHFLEVGSPRWTKLDLPDSTAAESNAFTRLVLSGQVQLRLRVLARGLPREPEVQATVIVTGDYTKMLAEEIRSVVPEFSGQVVVMPQLPVEYRLSGAGLKTQKEVREFGGGQFEEQFLSASLQFAIPGVVGILDVRYIEREPAAPRPPDDPASSPPAPQKKSPTGAAWPVAKTEGHVAAYLACKKDLYIKLAKDILDEMDGAIEAFRKEFGSTAIAEAITRKVGTAVHRACGKRDVDKTHTYKSRVQPLLRTPAAPPEGWNELLAGRHGEGRDELLDEIPLEDDDS